MNMMIFSTNQSGNIIVIAAERENPEILEISKTIVARYPTILEEIENNTWEIFGYSFKIVKTFIFYLNLADTLSSTLICAEKTKSLIKLYELSKYYKIPHLTWMLRSSIQSTELTIGNCELLMESEFRELIPEMYLCMDHRKIRPILTDLFTNEMWYNIAISPRLNTLKLYYKYFMRFTAPWSDTSGMLDIYYQKNKFYEEDVKWIISRGENWDGYARKAAIVEYILKKTLEIGILPKRLESESTQCSPANKKARTTEDA